MLLCAALIFSMSRPATELCQSSGLLILIESVKYTSHHVPLAFTDVGASATGEGSVATGLVAVGVLLPKTPPVSLPVNE
jgi:hypothetical protein